MSLRLAALATLTFTLTACPPTHIGPYTPRHRSYSSGAYAQRDPESRPSSGSLFSDSVPGYLEDTRAVRVGDVVVIHIDESADARGTATTNLGHQSSTSLGGDAFGLLAGMRRMYPDMDPARLLSFASTSAFQGQGNTTRAGVLTGSIAVRLTRELPNGDVFVEGTKVILINNEEYHLYISGVCRRSDIQQDNSIGSSRIADAEIEFTGRGDIAEQNRRGLLQHALDVVNPL
ncbi:MAG: flagellar basal body L-ring protein FlgH [Deltaproteobacteria bacterium]